MSKPFTVFCSFLLVALLAACGTPTASPAQPTTTPIVIPTQPAALPTQAPASPTTPPTEMASPTTAPTPENTSTTSTGTQGSNQPAYLDDRSTAVSVLQSLYNAIDRREYLRAYSYWRNPAQDPNVGTFEHFQQGYQNTSSVDIQTGTVSSDAGAGQFYYTVPVVLVSHSTQGQAQTYSGCYTLHISNPSVQGVPPFQGLQIESATVKAASAGAKASDLMAAACQGDPNYQPSLQNPAPTSNPQDINRQNYLDDRSSAVQVLRSLFNAINRKEYVRAYSYWQNVGQTGVPAFSQFQAGYQDTDSVQASFGTPGEDVGAGQIRNRVPVSMTVQTTQGKTQYFAGCYQLHLSQPAIQGVPPFQPWGIERASVKQVTSASEASTYMATVCNPMQ